MARTLEDMMNPKAIELQARYENHRVGTNLGWQLASKKFDTVEELAINARKIAVEITNDLNKAIGILEDSNGVKAESPLVSRPS